MFTNTDNWKAEKFYLKSYNLIKDITNETELLDDYTILSYSYLHLGDCYLKRHKDNEVAQQYYLKCLEIREMVYERTGSRESLIDLRKIYSSIGNMYVRKNDISQAEGYFLKELEINQLLNEKNEIIETRKKLVLCYRKLRELCKKQGKIDDADIYYQCALYYEQYPKIDWKKYFNKTFIGLWNTIKQKKELK